MTLNVYMYQLLSGGTTINAITIISISTIPFSKFTRNPAALHAVSNISRIYFFCTIKHKIYDYI